MRFCLCGAKFFALETLVETLVERITHALDVD